MGELDGKIALLTGAASGIGEASARALAAAGAKVVVAALHEGGAKVVADSIVESGGDAVALGFDTSDETQVTEAVAAATSAFGGIDILLNNAAITSVDFMMRDGMIHELDVDLWDQTMAVNLRGYMLCVKHVVPVMLERGGGVIVNTASGAGMQAETVRAAYGTSKAAVIGLTRNVATQYGKLGIRCVAVVPGLIMTKTVAANMPPPMIEMMRRHHLTPEIATPEDIANAVVFLASDRAAFITGSVIPVDGGFSVHSPSYADEMAMYAAMSGDAAAATVDGFRSALGARGQASLEGDDAAAVGAAFTEGAVWHGGGSGDDDGAWGRDEVVRRWNELASQEKGALHVEVVDVYGDGTHVVVVLEVSAPKGKDREPIRQANLFHLDAAGQANEMWSFPPDAAIADALNGGPPLADHPNVAQFRAAEEARARAEFGSDDLALIERFLHPDVHWHSPWGVGPSSREEVLAQFVAFKESTGGTMQLELNEVFADDTHAVSLVRLTANRGDKHLDEKEANVFHLDGKGRAYEFWGVADDQAAINAFWTD
jgi:NAD(P)-dependent dehydrogenase (short-subunit alcohol dehydrogenase family)